MSLLAVVCIAWISTGIGIMWSKWVDYDEQLIEERYEVLFVLAVILLWPFILGYFTYDKLMEGPRLRSLKQWQSRQ